MRRYTRAEAKALRDAATKGPWTHHDYYNMGHAVAQSSDPYNLIVGSCSAGDADLIAAAHDLASTVEVLEAERDALARRVEELTAEADLRVRREREAVVAWLRQRADRGWNSPTGGAEMWSALRHAAAMIEAGGHVEGGP